MTRNEIEKELLSLPDTERAAVMNRVLASLRSEKQAALREELQALEAIERRALGGRLEALMRSWFDGPSKVMTESDWRDIKNTRPEDVSPDSWAIPPGWMPPALR